MAGVKYSPEDAKLLGEWSELVQAGGWWYPFEGLVLCAERPARVTFDAERRLHCETDAAIECRDGYQVHAWHGTRVPSEWLGDKSSLDPKLALTWENVEQRRCLAEIIGWKNVLAQLPHRTVDVDGNPEIGSLIEVDLPDSPSERFLRVQCGTKREFVLPVPREMATALQANAWTYGLDETTYRPEVRT